MKTYPLFLVHLEQARCVVVGGGRVAARKVSALREAQAQVVLIARDLCEPLEALRGQGDIEVLHRSYQSGDLKGAFLAIAATDDAAINKQVWREAKARGILVNVVDDPDHCNFIAPSVVRRGPLTLAISTSGRCPALSRHLRRQLEQQFTPVYGDYVELLGSIRDRAVDSLPLPERRALWRDVFQSDILSLLASGDDEQAHQRARAILERHLSEVA